MHSPESTQAFAHLREASGPSPVRRISRIPEITSRDSALTPPGSVTGHTSTHFPQRVQASTIVATRSASAASNVSAIALLNISSHLVPHTRYDPYRVDPSFRPRPQAESRN